MTAVDSAPNASRVAWPVTTAFAVAAGGTGGFSLLLHHAGEASWRVALVACACAVFIAAALVAGRKDLHRVRMGHVVAAMGISACLQLTVIVATGGIRSPVAFLLLLPGLMVAFATGKGRAVAGLLAAVLAAIWGLAALDASGQSEWLVPKIFRNAVVPASGGWWTVFAAFGLSLAAVMVARISLAMRWRLDRSAESLMRAQRELVEEMRAHNRELRMTSATIAHELKNPLSVVQGLTTLMAGQHADSARRAEHLSVIVEEVHRMSHLLEEYLNFARPVSAPTLARVDLRELAQSVVDGHREFALQSGVHLMSAPGAPVVIQADPRQLRQVLANLLQNAVAATPEQGEVHIDVEAERDGGARLSVRDTGPGLPGAIADRVFEVGVSGREEGTGLGLPIARIIVERHGGKLHLTSPEAGGCSATVTLPASPPAEAGGSY